MNNRLFDKVVEPLYCQRYEDIADKIGTPSYVFDLDVIRNRISYIKEKLNNGVNDGKDRISICYAMKANPFVVGMIDDSVDGYEVCSPGEFKICERAGADIGKVVLSGVYKDTEETSRIVSEYGSSILYTAESENQFKLVNREAEKNGTVVDIILRVTTGNQFGMDESVLCRLIKDREQYKGLNIVGIQHFSGTQRHNMNIYREELEYCDSLIEKLASEYGFETRILEFGTGFFFEYFQDKPEQKAKTIAKGKSKAPFDEQDLLEGFGKLLSVMKYQGKVTLEIGRFIAASCGRYYTSVVDHKINNGKHFCITDGGMHQVNYFGQMMAMKLPYFRQFKKDGRTLDAGYASNYLEDVSDEKKKDFERINLCGALCTINDNLVKDMPVFEAEEGDIFEFQNTGAYSMTETPALFLSRDIPRVWLYSRKQGLMLMRERFETNVLNGGAPMGIDEK